VTYNVVSSDLLLHDMDHSHVTRNVSSDLLLRDMDHSHVTRNVSSDLLPRDIGSLACDS
jgi:hypothetical protein